MSDTTETGSDTQDSDLGEEPGQAAAAPESRRYDPVRNYDPEREFKYIETERGKVDAKLLTFTGPFAKRIIQLMQLSMLGVVWTAGAVPLLEVCDYFGHVPPPLWHAVLILWLPALALLAVLAWLLIRMPIKLKWAAVRIEMYLDDDISNHLFRERDASRGELRGHHLNSNWALLRLLRLRMRAFHFWHRISIHTFILNGMFFRRMLETPFWSPRLWVHAVPALAVTVFLSVHAGILMGGNGMPGGIAGKAGAYLHLLRDSLMSLRLGNEPGGYPTAIIIAGGFAGAYLAYRMARWARGYVMARLERFFDTSAFLTPYTHDSSRQILLKHDRLIRMLARIVTRGRNGDGAGGGAELAALILDELNHEDGLDDPV